jgi:hypothetical protein
MELKGEIYVPAVLTSPQEKLRYPLNRKIGEPQSWYECFEEKKISCHLPGLETTTVLNVA